MIKIIFDTDTPDKLAAALDLLGVITEGDWHEYTGHTTLTEDQAGCITEARDILASIIKERIEND